MNTVFSTPVLFLIFNRPDTTKEVFEAIRMAKPKQLFIAADGPRADREGEVEKCKEAREIATNIDWDCEVKTFFKEVNVGCKYAVSSAIDWFFNEVEEGIVLEDDCLPDNSFFMFCQEMLAMYRNDERVRHIGGSNFQFGYYRGDATYYFSKLVHVWGWASWRRAWKDYDVELSSFPEFEKSGLFNNLFTNRLFQVNWMRIFSSVYNKEVDTWDYQLSYANFLQNGLSIIPNHNLIKNIGFGSNATHTTMETKFANIPLATIDTIIHPKFFIPDAEADAFTLYLEQLPSQNKNRIFSFILNNIKKLKRI